MIINNTSKSVKVLKAAGLPALRLFPGHNECKDEHAERYFDNEAAKGMMKESFDVVHGDVLSHEEKEQIENARAKNAKLNKAKRVIQTQAVALDKNIKVMDDQVNVIEAQAKKLDDNAVELKNMKTESEDQGKQLLSLMDSVADLQKSLKKYEDYNADDVNKKEPGKPKGKVKEK